jgi:hypothetical protein
MPSLRMNSPYFSLGKMWIAIALYPRTGLLERFGDGTLKKTKVEWILED